MFNQRILIFTGGRLGPWAIELVQPNDYLIGADSGAYFLAANGFAPDIAIGDFDSVTDEQFAAIQRCSRRVETCDPIDKDFTDTELAFRHALAMEPQEVILVGALGTRFDHSLANVHLLRGALGRNIRASIVDAHNRVQLTERKLTLTAGGYSHVSLLPLTPVVSGIDLHGFRYPLRDATLEIGQSLGISNILEADEGTVTIREGLLLVIESRDSAK
ncbi:thiamine diphosphokinase [Paenibacillus methanolicus]|uniref:Thiamine diphosphokinase n=1 Tax=Paenibacillus methanolicus TaxID=582686 RepID=A0A5S5C2G8_9BACL|nr:thiamine diphosphokinase [Paenibacillus methanolicus]TYP72530.1 thiamine pyrophosphokinase [Paenibacillus methanolicus]